MTKRLDDVDREGGEEGHASSKQVERRGIAYHNEGIGEVVKMIKKNMSEKAKWR